MINLSSKSATVLVIFIVAVAAFCVASVFASMTGPISIIPNQTQSQDNISNLTSNLGLDNSDSYKSTSDNSKSTSKDTSSDSSKVETTTDKSSDSSSSSSSHSSSSSSKDSSSDSSSSSSSKDTSSSKSSSSKSSNVETTTG